MLNLVVKLHCISGPASRAWTLDDELSNRIQHSDPKGSDSEWLSLKIPLAFEKQPPRLKEINIMPNHGFYRLLYASISTFSSIKTPVNHPFVAKKNISFLASQLCFQDIEVIGFGTKRCQSLNFEESVYTNVLGTTVAEKDVVFVCHKLKYIM